MKKKRNIVLRIFIAICCLGITVVAYFYFTSKMLTVSYYSMEIPLENSIRIVQLTDLHNAEFGKDNTRLINLVEEQSPNLILMTGDMLNRENGDLTIVKELIINLSAIAPVYFGYGNHESDWEKNWERDLHEELSDTEAIVLNNEVVDVEVNGNPIRLAGYMGYYWQPHMMTKDGEQQELERIFYGEFQDTERYKILLNHIPTQWVDWEYINVCHVDLVFSGHYHGGLIRIPFIDQGLFAPYVGWFPPYTKGVYEGTQATCILSTGLGSEYIIPRFNNPPEIVVVDLIPCEESDK